MSFAETLKALGAEEKATELFEERFQESQEEWEEILARRAVLRDRFSDGDGDTLVRIANLVRNYGPKAAKYLGYPGLAAAATAFFADDGAFAGIIAKIGLPFGW